MFNFFCFSRLFPYATAHRFRLSLENPKHKRHGVASQYGVFCYGSCLVYFLLYDRASKKYEITNMKVCVNYNIMTIGTAENKDVISKKIEVQCPAFSGLCCGKPVMWNHIRTASEQKLNTENNSAFEAFSASFKLHSQQKNCKRAR